MVVYDGSVSVSGNGVLKDETIVNLEENVDPWDVSFELDGAFPRDKRHG